MAIAVAVALNVSLVNNKADKANLLALANVEALAEGEDATGNFWCCGNTNTCAKGPNFEIHGRLSRNPC